MLQTVQGIELYVVDIPDNPRSLLPITCEDTPEAAPYAIALDQAISEGVIQSAGKYGIRVNLSNMRWEVYKISDPQ